MIAWAALGLLCAPQQTAAEWKRLGLEEAARGRSEESALAFSKACDLDPRDHDACYFLGRQLFSLNRWTDAAAAYDLAVRSAPPALRSRTHRAAALNRVGQGDSAAAERHFREAVRDGAGPAPARADALTDYGSFLFREARTAEALALLRRAVSLQPKLPRAQAELGRVLLHLDRPAEAAAALELAVAAEPEASRYRILLGRAYLALGRTADAERELRYTRPDRSSR